MENCFKGEKYLINLVLRNWVSYPKIKLKILTYNELNINTLSV